MFSKYIPYAILLLFIYVYYPFFSKIDRVNSKFGIALAVITVLSSLLMSLGLTGLSLGASASDYFYLVPFFLAALGLENMLVVTGSIVSSPQHLDVKVRISEITVLTVSKDSSS